MATWPTAVVPAANGVLCIMPTSAYVHIIRKALAFAGGYYGPGCRFGDYLICDLRRLIERVENGDDDDAIMRLLMRIKWNCEIN